MGATGLVGQRFAQLLHNHPMFEVVGLAASSRSAGKPYREAVKWSIEGSVPESLADVRVDVVDPDNVPSDVSIVFTALPSEVAKDVEPRLAQRGFAVF